MAFLNLAPNPWFLAVGVVLDLLLGDPNYPAHPVRLIGWTLTRTENALRDAGFDGYGGGIALFVILSVVGAGGISLAVAVMPPPLASLFSVFLIYSLLALRDLLRHGADVERAATRGDLDAARVAVAKLVGRDTARMDGAAYAGGHRKPERESLRWFRQSRVLVRVGRSARTDRLQSGKHYGFDGGL